MTTNDSLIAQAFNFINEDIQCVLQFRSASSSDEAALGAAARKVRTSRSLLLALLHEVGQQNIDTILAVEQIFLTMEREYLPEAPIRISSLDKAIEELDATLDMLSIVRIKDEYQIADRCFSLKKNRKYKNLPYDQAQQFFESQKTRVSNIERASLDEGDRELLAAREANLEQARQQYTTLQQQALGIDGSSEVEVDGPSEVKESAACYTVTLKAA